MQRSIDFSLKQCEEIDAFVKEHLNMLNIDFFGYIKAYGNNKRFTLSNDPNYIKLYFDLKHYELDWIGFPRALTEYGGTLGTWQFCHKDHACCKIWQEHQKASNIQFYLWIYFNYKEYQSFFVFGMGESFSHFLEEGADRELTLLLNNSDLLRRFILNFKSSNPDMLLNAERHAYTVSKINSSVMEAEYNDYWGKFFKSIQAFKESNTPDKIYLTGKFEKTYLTREEAVMLHKYYYGQSYREIAKEYNISVRTVESRFSEIRYKLGAKAKLDLFKIINEHEVLELIHLAI